MNKSHCTQKESKILKDDISKQISDLIKNLENKDNFKKKNTISVSYMREGDEHGDE